MILEFSLSTHNFLQSGTAGRKNDCSTSCSYQTLNMGSSPSSFSPLFKDPFADAAAAFPLEEHCLRLGIDVSAVESESKSAAEADTETAADADADAEVVAAADDDEEEEKKEAEAASPPS